MIRHLKTAAKHIRRSPYQALAAVMTMTLTFYIAAVFFLTALGLQVILKSFERQPQITVFFSDIKTEEEVKTLDDRLKQTGKVERTVYVSKEEALKIYHEQNKDDPLLLEMVTADILPASLEIVPKRPEYLEEFASILSSEPGVEDVIYQKDIVDKLLMWVKAARLAGISLVSVLGMVSVLVLLTVIGMKIALREKEIAILRLLGATSWYIRWPFLFEGGIYGLLSAVAAWGATYLTVLYTEPFIRSFLSGGPQLSAPPEFMVLVLAGMVAGGLVLSIIGSFLALIRYT
ncbi:hypothetical protein A3B56_01740 [Candidatus Roizmanbacteria bacterium RIFCSPLOWO2_01_FULL_45_11]|uniref:Cell division protein FtsX n=1 Tax=Candidatus Roizmanbacteria bacterium RIFCSPLOWO2_01_FULL_45_11 TaxID=1802070 RepID=A0A1F7JFM3_9BACT|nr:MAG: hypothetical protein A3B56_01740 [Candidatus Roizmanbacteria bacterium RIFCSPLOWO2_01_FULL_45_11]